MGIGFYAMTFDKHFKGIITNAHVLGSTSSISILSKENKEFKITNTFVDNDKDIAFMYVEETHLNEEVPLLLYSQFNIIDEIITMGYPYIPGAKDAYLTYYKGEINSRIEDYFGNDLFLFSAKTSSGNSGSPIANNYSVSVSQQKNYLKRGLFKQWENLPTTQQYRTKLFSTTYTMKTNKMIHVIEIILLVQNSYIVLFIK